MQARCLSHLDNYGLTSPIYFVQLDSVPREFLFTELLDEVRDIAKGVVGISRSADFKRKELSTTVYIHLIRYEEAVALQQASIILNGNLITATIVDLIIGRTEVDPGLRDIAIRGAPFSLKLSELERKYVITTFYLIEIIKQFEVEYELVDARLCYDVQRQRTSKFGFISFLDYAALECYNNDNINVYNHRIQVHASANIPLLIHANQSNLIVKGKAEWNAEIREASWLNVDHDFDDTVTVVEQLNESEAIGDDVVYDDSVLDIDLNPTEIFDF